MGEEQSYREASEGCIYIMLIFKRGKIVRSVRKIILLHDIGSHMTVDCLSSSLGILGTL